LFDHADGFAFYLFIDILNLLIHPYTLHHLNHQLLVSLRLISILLHHSLLLNHDHFLLFLHLFFNHDSHLFFFVFSCDHLFYFDGFGFVACFFFFADGFLEDHAFDGGFVGAEDFLTAFDDAHFPAGLFAGAVFVFFVDVAVFVAMHGILKSLRFAASGAGASSTAGSSGSLAPESSRIMVISTAASAPRGLATAFAFALCIILLQGAIFLFGMLGAFRNSESKTITRPLGPAITVMASDAANERVTN